MGRISFLLWLSCIWLALASCGEKREEGDYSWRFVGYGDFAPRDGHGLVSFKNKLWILGGWYPADQDNFPKRSNNEVWASDNPDRADTWELIRRSAEWAPRHSFGAVVHDDRLFIIGGDTQQGYYQNDVWDTQDGVVYRRLTDNAPWGPRVLHLTASFNGKLWVYGGQTIPQFAVAEGEKLYRDAWSSPDGINWTKEADDLPFLPRGTLDRMVVHDGYLWAIGGAVYETPGKPFKHLGDVWRSADGISWELVLDKAPWPPRRYANVASFDGRLWLVGGYGELEGGGEGNLADTWSSIDGVNWESIPSYFPPRHAAGLAAHRDGLYLVSGNNFHNDIWVLRPRQIEPD